MRLITPLARLRHGLIGDARGVGATEFAFTVPVLCLMLIGVVDLGSALYAQISLKSATQAGVQYMLANNMDKTGAKTTVVQSSRLAGVRATPDPVAYCGCPSGTGVIVVACTTTCTNGKSPNSFIRVTAEYDHRNLLPYPGIARTYTLQGVSSVRVE